MPKDKNTSLPYYPWFVQDYRANRKVQRMSWEARGLYRELLDECWLDGSLPNDMEALADICGCQLADFEHYWPQIRPALTLGEDGRYRSEKMENQRTEKDRLRVLRACAGRLGGLQKLANQITDPQDAEKIETAKAKTTETLANASNTLAIASVCHIEEKRREEKRESRESLAIASVCQESIAIATAGAAPSATPKKPLEPAEEVTPAMVAAGVMHETRLGGWRLQSAIEAVVRREAAETDYDPEAFRNRLVASYEQYTQARGRLEITWGAEKFFAEGHWREESQAWPWKKGHEPPRKVKYRTDDPEFDRMIRDSQDLRLGRKEANGLSH